MASLPPRSRPRYMLDELDAVHRKFTMAQTSEDYLKACAAYEHVLARIPKESRRPRPGDERVRDAAYDMTIGRVSKALAGAMAVSEAVVDLFVDVIKGDRMGVGKDTIALIWEKVKKKDSKGLANLLAGILRRNRGLARALAHAAKLAKLAGTVPLDALKLFFTPSEIATDEQVMVVTIDRAAQDAMRRIFKFDPPSVRDAASQWSATRGPTIRPAP